MNFLSNLQKLKIAYVKPEDFLHGKIKTAIYVEKLKKKTNLKLKLLKIFRP